MFLALALLSAARAQGGTPCAEGGAQTVQIGIIDLYGLGRVSAADVRQALPFKEGDTLSFVDDTRPAILIEAERRLAALPGVARAHVHPVCCDGGRAIIYVGLEAKGAVGLRFRAAPRGEARLAADIVQTEQDLATVLMAAVQRGDSAEDTSQGHSLMRDPATRAIQERFIGFAARDEKALRGVLRDSRDAEQRAIAAQVLGYVADKQGVVADLVRAMNDADADVRNNAMRALAVFATAAPTGTRPRVRVPYEPFIALLHSPVWTDRNKALFALVQISERRAPDLLDQLRRQASLALAEMARWKSDGHALPALLILGRVAGQADDAIVAALERGDRESVIRAALERR